MNTTPIAGPFSTMPPAGFPLPTFRYSLESADGQIRTINYSLQPTGEVREEEDTGWDNEDDVQHTVSASLDIAWPNATNDDVLCLSGDEHREMEDRGLFDSLLRGIASGLPARTVLNQLSAQPQAA